MTSNEIANRLKAHAAANSIFRDVCVMFATRERTRFQLTVSGLDQRMKAEGFNIDPVEYPAILRFLASLNLGTLVTDSSGRVTCIKGLKTTLQSIGKIAVGAERKLTPSRQRNRYADLKVIAAQNKKVVEKVWKAPQTATSITVALPINGKLVSFPMPKELTPEEIATIIVRLQDRSVSQP